MNPERWRKIKELFEAASERAPAERKAFLDEACAGDEELRKEVEALLSSFESEDSFLEKPAVCEMAATFIGESGNLIIGQALGHYRILSQIGAGGMGEVFLAEDERLRRRVALKLLLTSDLAANSDAKGRLMREARAAAALDHPNICAIHEIGEADGRAFIVMQFVEGETLAEIIRRGALSVRAALDIAVQVVDALAEAHKAGVIHRDIKPSNIIVNRRHQAKVLDFGLAKFVENRLKVGSETETASLLSAPDVVMGTAPYMSPEQARGERLDARTDIFSFGVMLYEMLCGEQPFRRDTNAETIAALLTFDPPLEERIPAAPEELRRIIAKCLAKDKTQRYQTADEPLADLRRLQKRFQTEADVATEITGDAKSAHRAPESNTAEQAKEAEILAPATLQTESAKKSQRAKFLTLGALVLGLAALIAAGAWFISARRNSFKVVSVQRTTQVTDWAGLDDFPSISPDGKSVAYCSDHSGAFEIYIKQLTPGAKEIQLTNDGQQNFQPVFSPDGSRIAYHSKARGGIWVIPASGGEAKQLTDFGTRPAWSPDGKQIAFQSYPLTDLGAGARTALPPSTLWIISSDGGAQPRQLTQVGTPAGGHGAPAFSPDGKLIAFEVDDYNLSSVWVMPISGGEAHFVSKPATEPVFAPDGKSLIFIGGRAEQNGAQQIAINAETGAPIGEAQAISGSVALPRAIRGLRFSADGKRFVYSTLDRRESLALTPLNPKTGEPAGASAPIVQKVSGRIHLPAFSPDGKQVAFTSCQQSVTGCDIWLANPDGSNQTQLTTAESNEMEPNWFPNAEEIAYITDRTGHWTVWKINLNTKREEMLLDLKDSVQYARLSPDGKQVAFNFERGGVINVWTAQVPNGEPKQLTFEKELAGFPAWSPDGRWLAYQTKRGDSTFLMLIPSEGGAPEQLTFEKGQSWAFGWSPDGDKVLFAGFRNGLWNVYSVSRTTKKERQLTDYKKLNSFVRYPAWSPLGDKIVYEYTETTGNIWVADLKYLK